MEAPLFLIAYVVAVGLTYVQPDNAESADQTVKENFYNFFDSIKKNDFKKSESYRSFLEQEAAREQEVFDMMKEELKFLRPRNRYHKSGENSQKVAQFKREVTRNQEEDDFIELYGNNNGTSGYWPEGRAIASDEEKLKYLCKQAHQQFGLGHEDVVKRVKYHTDKVLSFDNYNDTTNRVPISLDVISYSVTRLPDSAWYFTKGTKSYCVFYLMLQDAIKKRYRLGREVCGIHMPTPKPHP